MLTSLSLIFLVGLAMGAICSRLKLPRILGMLATGIVLGPYVLDFLAPSILSISADLRKMALVIILLKAGLSLNIADLKKFGKLWLAAEVMLFVLVGAAVDIRYTLEAGLSAVLMIFVALLFRTLGVSLCTLKTTLTAKERAFCVIAYLPKATVQAAIGSVPINTITYKSIK